MAKKRKLEPGLIDYWDQLTQTDIALLCVAVQTSLGRNNPGALPFLKVQTACQCIDWHLVNNATKKGPFYKLLHKLESWRWGMPSAVKVGEAYIILIDPERLKRLVPIAKRRRLHVPGSWHSTLPFVRGDDGGFTMEVASKSQNAYYVTVAPKYLAALRAWFEGVGHPTRGPKRKPRPRSR